MSVLRGTVELRQLGLLLEDHSCHWFQGELLSGSDFSLPVTIKQLRGQPQPVAVEQVERLHREARFMSSLCDSSIPKVLGVWEHPDGDRVVWESLSGMRLSAFLTALRQNERRLAFEEVAFLLHSVLQGVTEVHIRHQGRRHHPLTVLRQLDPSVFFLTEQGRIKMVDFWQAYPTVYTNEHRWPASLRMAYFAPEVLAEDGGFSHASDVFSLGLLMWELLAGESAYEGLSGDALGQRVRSGAVPSIASFRPDTPVGMAEIMQLALHPNPQERFPNAEAMLEELEANVSFSPRRSERALRALVQALRRPRQPRTHSELEVLSAESSTLEEALDSALLRGNYGL